MARAVYVGPDRALALYDAALAAAYLERKGAKTPYTSHGGHMFSFLDPAGMLALRLSPELREEFTGTYGGDVVEQHGRVMKEYVAVPDALLTNTKELSTWIGASRHWVGTLKPKPTKRSSG